ncbi:uncharacterized protein B0J16DRAFT_307880 [Fusarium flagelliforme]|uniref:F-box domain-containing protein n=1 Tax=Fusarium flagelliforme TaxID=2675880 RepID=A0A395MB07_9HYPO|nr:uncharacterized protein B0J16DRAFT_307880 [Fusarium flagelliforme]KAH7183560.1 hypothetical protein B0J16DRAFT_307880 [Fusarium flagelliforme]RFN45075.1 f-box domain-containing protein [Fusarium flagelliforme]
MEKVPNEVLDLILSHLTSHRKNDDLYQARLVARRWNQLATKHIFRTIILYNNCITAPVGFQSWHKLLGQESVRDTAQRVIIHTWPDDVRKDEGPSYYDWDKWEHDGEWPAFTSAIDRIIELDHLQALEIHFSPMCRGEESHWNEYDGTDDDREMPGERKAALEAVYKAVKQREARGLQENGARISPIRELRVNHLQNIHPPDVLVNGLLKGIERLDLNILQEKNSFLNYEDFKLPEKFQFDGILRNTILAPIADQLVELSLGAQYEWGLLPARFKGKGLKFPKLKKLKLDFYAIGYYDQIDWVLDQKSLTTLHLDDCQIVTHLHFNGEEEEWGISTDDWKNSNEDPWLRDEAREYYTFDLRWNTIFDKIRDDLPRLTEFRASWAELCGTKEDFSTRYIHFTTDDFPVPFVQVETLERMKGCKNGPWDVAHAAYGMDVAALEALKKTIYERRKEQSI